MGSEEEQLSPARSSTSESERSADDASAGFGSYVRVFYYADGLSWLLNIVGTFAAIGSGSVLPLMNLIFGKTVTTFNDFGTGAITPAEFRSRSVDWTLYFIYLFIAKTVLTYFWSFCFNLAALRTTKALRIHFLQQTLRQDIAFFDKANSGSISIQVTTNGNLVNTGISEKIGLIIQGIATFVAAFIVAFVANATLTGITLAVVPTIILSMIIGVAIETIQEGRILAFYSSAGQVAEEIVASMRNVHAFWAHPTLAERYTSLLGNAKRQGMKKSPNLAFFFSIEFFCIYAGYGLAFWQGIRRYARGEISQPGSIVTVIFAVILAATAITQVAPQLMHLSKAASAADGLFKVIDRKSAIDALSNEGERPESCQGTIMINRIHFAYPSRPDVEVLRGMDLALPAGRTTALVGASGSGKSTIVGLIERWYDATEGHISLDGRPIEGLDIEWLRTNIRLVQQEPVLFNATIFENVCYGLVGTKWQNASEQKRMELVKDACRAAFAHDFIEQLPEGYHTGVGERAGRLSGGQKQRIAIARSIISDPKVLLLDEATSALDPKAERIVQAALDNVSAQRTTLIIAHKLSTVRKADSIAVMSAGAITEQGTHEELLERPDGTYSRLVKAQDLGKQQNLDLGEGSIADDQGQDVMPLLKTKTSEFQVEAASEDTAVAKTTMGYGLLKCIYLIIKQQRSLWFLFFLVLIDCILGGLTYPALAVLFAKIMNAFTLPVASEMIDQGDFYSLMFFIVALANLAIYFSIGWWTNNISQVLSYNYRSLIFHDTLKQDMKFFDKPENTVGAIVSRLSSQPTQVQELISINVGIILIAIVNVVASSVLAIAFAWKLGLVVVFGALPPVSFAGYLRIRLEYALDDATTQRFADSAALAAESVSAIRTVASLALERTIINRYEGRLASIERRSVKFLIWTMFWFALSQSVNLLAMALGFWYGSRLLSYGEIGLQEFYIAFLSVIFSGEAAAQFFSYSTSITKARTAANYIMWLNSQVPDIRELGPEHGPKDPSPTDEKITGADVRAEHIEFTYPERPSIPVLRGVSAAARPGQSIALVGPSGCGKTTMIALLERFYDLASGRFLFNDLDIATLCPRAYRANIALVQQEPTLYGMSIADNVALGMEGKTTPEQIEDACRRANIYEFAISLPSGLATLCGKSGTQLSGGQRQRIAIARALIRKPQLLLLDEATSALDTESEKIVQEALEKGSEGCTTVAVAHRLSTIKGSDCIFVFAKGQIVEQGTHEELIRKRGVYHEMCLGQGLDSV